MKAIKRVATAAITVMLLAGLQASLPADCSCELAKKKDGWCRQCKVGYVASIQVPSAALFEALDAHGHDIDPKRLRCASCKKALENDGFCDRCRMGFVKKQAYLSRLTYYVARGKVTERSKITCATCRKNAQTYGWCESCKVGRIGNFALDKKADLEEAQKAFKLLERAIRMLDRCETCAVALFTGGRCRACKLTYRNGNPVAAKAKR